MWSLKIEEIITFNVTRAMFDNIHGVQEVLKYPDLIIYDRTECTVAGYM
jgi:hypothetical protein